MIQPPKKALQFLRWFCREDRIDEIEGDLIELFEKRASKTSFRAKWLFALDVIKSFDHINVKKLTLLENKSIMLKNNLVIAWRSLTKNKVYSLINILGLAVGMAAFLLIALYVRHELNYDKFHENKDNIYRVQQDRYNKGELTTQWAAGNAGIGPDLKANFPEVEKFVKMRASSAVVRYGDNLFKEDHTYYATTSFFEVFSVKLIEGVDSLVLKKPYTMAMSESMAAKYFADENPIGKSLRHNGVRDYLITGIFEDIPAQSHLQADMLYSFETYVDLTDEDARTDWNWDGFYTYITLVPGSDPKELEAKLPKWIDEYQGEDLAKYDAEIKFNLQPVESIHLYSNYMMEFKANGNGKATYFLLVIAFFIILIAWVNYVNLSTARSMERAKEVGIRKVMGSMRHQLAYQFLVESFMLNFLALVLGLLIMVIVLPYFNQLSGIAIALSIANSFIWGTSILLLLVGGLSSGIYPALVLSGFKPVTVLKGKLSGSSAGAGLRKGLVIFQFMASLVLMVGTLAVFEQLRFMRSQDLGVNIDQTLVLTGPNITDSLYNDKFNTFKQTLSAYPRILSFATSTSVPGNQPDWSAGGIRLVEETPAESNQYRVIGFDGDFIDAFGLELIAGRKFDQERSNERTKVLFNESAVKLLGFATVEEVLQKDLYFWGDTFEIVGVLKDYHQESIKKSFEPLVFRYNPNAGNFYSIKVQSDHIPETIELVREEWQAAFPGNPFDYFFLDDHYNKQYKADLQFGQVFSLFAALAIFIACLGLFGLASYMTMQRTKEIGVRKVLGASISSILLLLSKDFSKFIITSIILAIPISWYLIDSWLQGFATKINISWWLFAVPALTLMVIALGTISFQTVKSALTNPVDSLRDE